MSYSKVRSFVPVNWWAYELQVFTMSSFSPLWTISLHKNSIYLRIHLFIVWMQSPLCFYSLKCINTWPLGLVIESFTSFRLPAMIWDFPEVDNRSTIYLEWSFAMFVFGSVLWGNPCTPLTKRCVRIPACDA